MMTTPQFDDAFKLVVGEEGNYSNDPRDAGGETKYGISKRAYPHLDIANLTLDQAKEIYWTDYWSPLMRFRLADKFMFLAFECAVNQGLTLCTRLLGLAKGNLSWFLAERALSYAADRTFNIDGRGWFRRLFADALT